MVDWETVKLPRQMIQRVNEFVETDYAKQNGFTSKSQVIVTAVRDFLKKYSQTKISIITTSSNNVIMLDDKLESPVFVEIKNKKIKCSEDGLLKNEKPCIHMVLSLYETQFFNTVKKNELISNFGKEYNEKQIEIDQLFLKFYGEEGHVELELKNNLKKSQKIQVKK